MRIFKKLSLLVATLLIIGMILAACRPGPDLPDTAVTMMAPPAGSISVASAVASQIATLRIPEIYWRYRVIRVPPGWFMMGSDPDEDKNARGDEKPQIDAYEPGFWIGESEVTNREYTECVEAGACSPPAGGEQYGSPQYEDHPVVFVNWYQAETYCQWIDGRLPTEAEWEKAARGMSGSIYPWGDSAPTCDHANAMLPGCQDGASTHAVGVHPTGNSPAGVMDLAGNVREWTADWYGADSYFTAAAYMPTGPDSGSGKVVRGGGFNDFEEGIRATVRLGLAPEQAFADVGFRCVPTRRDSAPMCVPSFAPLCYDPDVPFSEEPCEPGGKLPGPEGVEILGMGCAMNREVSFQFSTNGGGNSGYSAKIEDDSFQCKAVEGFEDVVQCYGPEQPMGRNVQITICAPGASPNDSLVGASSTSQAGGVTLASFPMTGVISLMIAGTPTCPDGFVYEAESDACVRDAKEPECPQDWSFVAARAACLPNDAEEDCPPGTTYMANFNGCKPDDGECPQGFALTAGGICEPVQNLNDDCPPGYWLNPAVNCCEAIPQDNFGCEDGYSWDAKYEKCVPLDDFGCPPGTTYDGYGRCGQNPDQPGPEDPAQGDCPPGTSLAALNTCGRDDDDINQPEQGTLLRTNDLTAASGLANLPDCPQGYVYDPRTERCVELDENGCEPGYFFDEELKRCRPTNGPNSPCPIGYAYNPRTACCTPQPGMDGTRCAEDIGTLRVPPDPCLTCMPFANTSFDPNSGECGEADRTREPGQPEDCPPGTLAANFGGCDQMPDVDNSPTDDPEVLEARIAECPKEYWNPNTDTCDYPEPDCGQNMYFDERLGFCVRLQHDCCEIGQDFSALYERCVDVTTEARGENCPEGYELINGLCWLTDRTEGQGLCWTITRNTPQCVGPCDVGYEYDPATGRCIDPSGKEPDQPAQPTDPCAGVVCSPNNCPQECCIWQKFATGEREQCIPR